MLLPSSSLASATGYCPRNKDAPNRPSTSVRSPRSTRFWKPTHAPFPSLPLVTPVPTAVPSGEATESVSRSGFGSGESLKFTLDAGDYQADWTVTDDADTNAGCYAGVNVKSDDPDFYGTVVSTTIHHTQSGTNYLNNVPAGSDYYIDATTTCSWTVTLTRLP